MVESRNRKSSQGFGRAPGLLSTTCDEASRSDLETFFRPKIGELEGIPRTLAQAEESIGYCIAFNNAKGSEFRNALPGTVAH